MVKSLIKRTKELFSRRDKDSGNERGSKEQEQEQDPDKTTQKQKQEIEKGTFPTNLKENNDEIPQVTIVGAGIIGLVLALALDKHCGLKVDLFEQASAFHDDVGAGMGMYPNGLRVIRDISPQLLQQIQDAGYPYLLRRYERHDGTEIATATETKLFGPDCDEEDVEELQPIGLRRWKLQKILYQAVIDAGIKVHFNKRLESLEQFGNINDGLVRLVFTDGTIQKTKLLLAADGSKSGVRTLVSEGKYQLKYTGTTCLMGTATVARQARGLCLPASETTKCHGAFYPTGEHEQCFQFHFPTPISEGTNNGSIDPKDFSWGGLTHAVEQEECNKLADQLVKDGWDEKFIQPLRHVDKALKIGFSTLEPHLESYVFGRVALVGDSAHPPVPYLGQGAQQGLEDAGTMALLLQHFCKKSISKSKSKSNSPTKDTGTSSSSSSSSHLLNSDFVLDHVDTALTLYNRLRLPRTAEILNRGKLWGQQQQKRAENTKYNQVREEHIRREVFYHETLPILLPAVRHDYREDVQTAIKEVETKNHASKETGHHVSVSSGTHPSGPGDTTVDHPSLRPVPEETACY